MLALAFVEFLLGPAGVYLVDKNNKWNKDTSQKIGYTASLYTFYNSDFGKQMKDAVIRTDDFSGANFLQNQIVNNTPSLLNYISNAKTNEKYDFKVTNGTDKIKYKNTIDHFRGMPIARQNDGLPIFASARDIGNIAAGYIAANNHINWSIARYGFDGLQSYQENGFILAFLNLQFNTVFSPEGKGTQAGQLLGYKYYEKLGK